MPSESLVRPGLSSLRARRGRLALLALPMLVACGSSEVSGGALAIGDRADAANAADSDDSERASDAAFDTGATDDAGRPLDAAADVAPQDPKLSATDCGAIEYLPAAITVSSTGVAPFACHPAFTIVGGTDGGDLGDGGAVEAEDCNGGGLPFAGCDGVPNGTRTPCQFVLYGLSERVNGPVSVEVSEPGYAPRVVDGVAAGRGGCAADLAPTHVSVRLQPLDAGADAKVDSGF